MKLLDSDTNCFTFYKYYIYLYNTVNMQFTVKWLLFLRVFTVRVHSLGRHIYEVYIYFVTVMVCLKCSVRRLSTAFYIEVNFSHGI